MVRGEVVFGGGDCLRVEVFVEGVVSVIGWWG